MLHSRFPIIHSKVDRIYLDHAATTPLLPEVREAMRPWLESAYGNPSSLHEEGRRAKDALDEARETLAEALGCLFAEVVFTSGGTEAANLAILGAALANRDTRRNRVFFGAAEHHCVLHTVPLLERLGYRVEIAPVDRIARIDLDALEGMLGDDVLLVAVQHANNELGTIQPAAEIAKMAREAGALYVCDAVQTFLCGPLTPKADTLGADLLFVSAHKAYGPKGAGALYVRAGTKVQPVTVGGGQERELRAGTENVAGIVGFGAAVRPLHSHPELSERTRTARDSFRRSLDESRPEGLRWTLEDSRDALPGHAHLRLDGLSAESMLIVLDRMGVAASSGAACSSGSLEPSHVLLACGYSEREAREGLRFTFGIDSTEAEAAEAASRCLSAAGQVRSALAAR